MSLAGGDESLQCRRLERAAIFGKALFDPFPPRLDGIDGNAGRTRTD
jgi:hypothetical protein